MRRAAGFLTVLLLLAACGGGADEGSSSGSTAEDATTTTAEAGDGGGDDAPEVALPAGAPVVEVIDPGAEPRRELRFQPAAGDKQQFTVRQEQTQVIEIGDVEQTVSSIIEMDIAYFIDEVTDGVIETRVVYEDARIVEADDAVRATLEQVLEPLADAEGRTEFDARGYILDADAPDLDLTDLPGAEELLTGLEDQLAALAAPFPDEPVGQGAVWTVTSTAEFAAILTVDTVFTVTLTELTDDLIGADVDIVMEFSAADGSIAVESSDLTGDGTITWPVDGVVALFDQTIEGTVVFTVQGQRVSQHQVQRAVMTAR